MSLSMLLLLIGTVAVLFPSPIVLSSGKNEHEMVNAVKRLAVSDQKEKETFEERLEMMEAKWKMETSILEEKAANATDKELARQWAFHKLFQAAIGMQEMMGNYCKGDLHYKKNFKVDFKPMDEAIVELMEKHDGAKNVVENGKMAIDELKKKFAKEKYYWGSGWGKEKNNVEKMVEKGLDLMFYSEQLDNSLHEYHQKQEKKLGLDKEIDKEVEFNQVSFDRVFKEMKDIVGQEHNPFEELLKARHALELAGQLWKAIVEYTQKEEGSTPKAQEKEQHVVILAYNAFARKLEPFLNNGALSRNLYGQFNMASFKKKLSEMDDKSNVANEESSSLLDKELMLLIRQLLKDYYQLRLPQMDVLKIRGIKHMVLVLGLIEYDFNDKAAENYDFVADGPKREKFSEDLDDVTSVCSPKKARAIANSRLIRFSEADNIYYQMVQNGWDAKSYSKENGKVCRTFVWNFLCDLFNGKCLGMDQFPPNFLQLDRHSPLGSVFNKDGGIHRFPLNWWEFIDTSPRKLLGNKCVLSPLQMLFKLDERGMPKGKLDTLLPLRVVYHPGKYYGTRQRTKTAQNDEQKIVLDQVFGDEQQLEEVLSNSSIKHAGGGDKEHKDKDIIGKVSKPTVRLFKAQLMVYSCKVQGKKEVVYVKKMGVVSKTHSLKNPSLMNIMIKGQWMDKQKWIRNIDLAVYPELTVRWTDFAQAPAQHEVHINFERIFGDM